MPDITSALTMGRTAALVRMRDTCLITKPGPGERILNPLTRKYEDPPPVPVYEGPCRIPQGGGGLARNGAGDQSFGVGEFPLDLPFRDDAMAVGPGMTVHYLTSRDNPSLVGKVYGVTEQLYASQGTKLRFRIKSTVAV